MSPVVSDRPTIRNGRIVGTRVHFWRAGLRASNGGGGAADETKTQQLTKSTKTKRGGPGPGRTDRRGIYPRHLQPTPCAGEVAMRRIETAGYEVRIEDHHPPGRAAEFLRDPERHQEPLRLWRETVELVTNAAGIKRRFAAGFVLDDGRVALSADGDRGAVICINPNRYAEAIAKYGHEPLSLAAYLHSVACHEIAHLDGRMGHGHDEEYIAAREEMGAVTAHTLPLIAEAAACLLGLGPCTRRPMQVDAARQEALRACQGGSCQVDQETVESLPSPKTTEILLPTLGWSGTSRERLFEGYVEAADALRTALDRLQDAAPNGRDYFTQGPDAATLALRDHAQRVRAVQKVLSEIEDLAEHCAPRESLPSLPCKVVESLPRKRSDVVRRVRAQLGPQHLRPDFRRARPEGSTASWGCCYVAAEAVWHALGGPDSGLRPTFIRHEGAPHWYLVDVATGEVVDPTVDQFSSPPDYSRGTGKGFLTSDPSQRAQAILSSARLPTILRTR